MKKFLTLFSFIAIAWLCNVAYAEAYKTLTFPDENKGNNTVGAYTETWTAIIGTDSWSIANFNNNNWNNSWTYIKCGSKKAASVASIATDAPIDRAISNVVVTIDAITVASVNSISLVVASDSNFETVNETINAASIAKGDLTFTIATPTQNKYYKLLFDTKKGSSNGLIQVSKVVYNAVDAPATELTAPVISGVENGGVYWNSATVNISKPELATSIAYDVTKDGVSVFPPASESEATEAFSRVFTEPGKYMVSASAKKGTETKAAEGVEFVIKSGAVASIAELLEKGPQSEYSGATFIFTCPLTVTYADDSKNVYVRDAAGDALLLYNTSAKVTITNGSKLEGVTGTYTLYLSNIPELSTTSLPTATAGDAVAPKTITIAEAAANMSQYVQIKNVTFNSSATEIECEGETLAFYKGKGTVPSNLTAKYTVIGVISYYNNAVQLNYIDAIEEVGALGTPVIEVAGETNAEGAYLDKVELTFVYPANATSMEYKIGSKDAVTVTKTTTITYSTCGETTIEVTAYQNEESNAESKTIKIIPSAPTLSLAAGFYMEDKTLTITAPEGAELEGVITCGGNTTNVSGTSYNANLEAINGDATTYELVVYSKKDGIESDYVGGNYVIDPNTIDLRKTGTIVIAQQHDHNTTNKSVESVTLIDNLGTTFTLNRTDGSNSSFMAIYDDGLRLYKNNNYELVSDQPMTKIVFTASPYDLQSNDATNWTSTESKTFVCEEGVNKFTFNSGTSSTSKIQSIAISYGGLEHFEKVKNGTDLLGMEAGKFYQVNVNLEGVKENGGVLYARTADVTAAKSEPREDHKGFDSYEDGNKLDEFDQCDWVAIDGLSSAYAGKQIATGFVASYDGTKLVPVKTTMGAPGSDVTVKLNTFGVANVFYGNYENTADLKMQGGYQPFFVKAKVNEVAYYLGSVKLNADGKYELWGSGVCGKFDGKGLEIEATNGTELAESATYKQIEGVLVADAAANGGVKLIAMNVTDTPTGVESLKANGKAAIYGTEGAVVVAGADGKVAIFDAMGRMVKSVSAEGAATVEMPAGYYIVRTAGTAKAVIVK